MERVRQPPESESQEMACLGIPTNELIFNTEVAKCIWPDEYNNESFIEQIKSRKENYKSVCDVFDALSSPAINIEDALIAGDISETQAIRLYDALSDILKDKDYHRLALYLPFEILPNKSWIPDNKVLGNSLNQFENSFLNAWYNLLAVHDARAHFADGDILETEAQPSDPPRVVKAAHLIPWLTKCGIIGVEEISALITDTDAILQRSVADTLPILDSMGLLKPQDRDNLLKIKYELAIEELQEPLFISEKRTEWLKTRYQIAERPDKSVPISSLPSLSGPFSENFQNLITEANDIKDRLLLNKHIEGLVPAALIGGSRLKGYMDENSDLDTYIFVNSSIDRLDEAVIKDSFSEYNIQMIRLDNDGQLCEPKEYWAHELINAAWVGDKKIISKLQNKLISPYFYEQDSKVRSRCLEILEIDLLQYRLMHKGYARHYPIYSERLCGDEEIDGQSPFYDSGYRQIATKLFIDKVFIPNIFPI